MAYATKQDMIDRFGEAELIDITRGAGSIDDTVLSRALSDADSTINSYLVGRYSLPLASVPDRLKIACCDIGRYHLYDRDDTDQIRLRYKDQIRWLEQVAEGKVSLGLDAASAVVATTAEPEISAPDRVFDDTTLADFLGNV